MQITFVSHASILIETRGITILSDPWWRGPCFGAQWWNYPTPYLQALEGRRIDYIYISHGHHDHFHPGTLPSFSAASKILVSRKTNLTPFVKELGFDVIEVDDDEIVRLGEQGVTCRIMETHAHHTLMAISDGQEVCLNLNDALHSAPAAVQTEFVAPLKHRFPKIDYVFCGYGAASHFPNCYVVPGADRAATAARRQRYFNRQWAKLIAELNPRFGFPFAADVVFLEEDLFWINEPTHNSERPTEAFRAEYPNSAVITMDIAPGFAIENGKVLREVIRKPILATELRSVCFDQIERANRYGRVEENAVKEVSVLLECSLDGCAEYLEGYEGDYQFLIRFRNTTSGIRIKKKGRDIRLSITSAEPLNTSEYDLVYTTRLPYLKWSLTKQHGDEILFVGSGGIFEYRDAWKARHNLHRELIHVLRKRDAPPPPRYGSSSKLIYKVKQTVKKIIGRTEPDLYDLQTWTVFKRDRA